MKPKSSPKQRGISGMLIINVLSFYNVKNILFKRQSAFNKILFLLVQEVCELPLMPGSCFAAFPRVYFDSSDGQCKDFTYGGCAGNANNFRNKEECEELCGGISYTMLHVLLNDKLKFTRCRSTYINLFYFRRRDDGGT